MAQQESERQRDLERRRRQESLAREREWERLRERERMQREAEAQREREAVRMRLRYKNINLFNLILSITQLSTRYYSSTLKLTKRCVCAREQELEEIRQRNMALAQQEEEREREREHERQIRSNLETRLERTVAFSVGLFQNVCQVVPLLFPVVTACKELLNYGESSLFGQPSQRQLEQLEHLPAVSTRGGGVGDAERRGGREGAGGTKGGGGRRVVVEDTREMQV